MIHTIGIDAYLAAIVATLRDHFGDRIAHYGAYEPWDLLAQEAQAALRTPALLIELEELSTNRKDGQDGAGRLGMVASVAAHCVLSIHTPRFQEALPQFAAAVAAVVLQPCQSGGLRRGNTWGYPHALGLPDGAVCIPGEFAPGLHGRDSWLVRWDQVVFASEELPA